MGTHCRLIILAQITFNRVNFLTTQIRPLAFKQNKRDISNTKHTRFWLATMLISIKMRTARFLSLKQESCSLYRIPT